MIVNCPECKKEISEKAETCPNCGYRLSQAEIETLKKEKKQANKVGSIGCLSIIIIALLFFFKPWSYINQSSDSSTYQDSTSDSFSEEKMPLAYQLATIENKSYVSEDGSLVRRFESLLNQLESKYVDDKQKIADVTVTGYENLAKRGIEESMITLMEGMLQIYDSKTENMVYHEYLASYVVLRVRGRSDQEALKILQEMINETGITTVIRALKMGVQN
jgi:hypothetical protein